MKNNFASQQTRQRLAASLKKLMEKKPLSKITISELITDCGVNRKTFYYHFEDIPSLVRWMFEQETIEVIRQYDLLLDFSEIIRYIIGYITSNKHILACAYDALGRHGLHVFLHDNFFGLFGTLIDNAEKQLGKQIDEEYKTFLCTLYCEATAGLIGGLFEDTATLAPEKALRYIDTFFRSSIKDAILAYDPDDAATKKLPDPSHCSDRL